MKLINIYLFLLFIVNCCSFNYHVFNFNTIIRRSLDNSIINFINVDNINNLKIKHTAKFLVLKYEDNPYFNLNPVVIATTTTTNKLLIFNNYNSYDNYDDLYNPENNDYFKIFDIIKNNKKPILILYEKKIASTDFKYKHMYLIKNKNNYIFKYNYIFNNQHHKYFFDINATEISKYETNWNITASFNYKLKEIIDVSKISIINWFINSFNNNFKNYFYKKYLLFQYLTNN
jgi:hypothetical protein